MAGKDRTVNHIDGERWGVVPGTLGMYSASNLGRIKRNPFSGVGSDGRRLSFGESLMGQRSDPDGYKQVKLSRLCPLGVKQPLVHRLVFETLVRPLAAGEEINHINAIKDDNRVENLEAVPHSGNMAHAMRSGLMPIGERAGRAKLTNRDALEIVERHGRGETPTSIARAYGVSQPTVSNMISGRCWGRITGIPHHSRRQIPAHPLPNPTHD